MDIIIHGIPHAVCNFPVVYTPTRSPSWVPTWIISLYTVPYDLLYGSTCRKFYPTVLHIGSHVSFISPRRPTRSPLWFPVGGISSHTARYGFLYGPPCRKSLSMPTHMGSCTGSSCFLYFSVDTHAIPC